MVWMSALIVSCGFHLYIRFSDILSQLGQAYTWRPSSVKWTCRIIFADFYANLGGGGMVR